MGESVRILIAEDLDADFELARREVRKVVAPSEYLRVETREAFLAALRDFRPDVVISDFRMSVFDGLTALKLALAHAPGTPVIILTSAINEDTAVECMKAGAADYVVKEHLKRLGQAVIRALKASRERVRRRSVEAALKESDEHLRQLAENIDSVLFVYDLEPDRARLSYLSPACDHVFGRTRDELLRDPMAWMDLVHADDLERVRQTLRAVLENGAPSAETRYRAIQAGGAERHIRLKVKPILSNGGVARIAGMAEDITARIEAETANTRLQAQLAQAQKMETVGRLAGGVAHDFNNLLTAIIGYAELVFDLLPDGSQERADVQEIRHAANSAAQLTRQLLAFARQQPIAPRIFNPSELLIGLDKLLGRLIGEDIELVTQAAPDLGLIRADAGQIEQLLVNLAVNARDAMPDGGKLTIEMSNIWLDQAYARAHVGVEPGAYVALVVSDSGVGMDEVIQRYAF